MVPELEKWEPYKLAIFEKTHSKLLLNAKGDYDKMKQLFELCE
jgi:hypothetical protein